MITSLCLKQQQLTTTEKKLYCSNIAMYRKHLIVPSPHVLDLFAPGFVTWSSTNVGEGLVKLVVSNDVPGHWVDMWRSGTFHLYSCEAPF